MVKTLILVIVMIEYIHVLIVEQCELSMRVEQYLLFVMSVGISILLKMKVLEISCFP